MTLVEVLVTVAIIGILALVTMNLTVLLGKSTEYGDRSQSLMALSSLVRQHIKYSNLCDQAIGQSSTYNQNFDLGNPEIRMRLPNIHAGPNMLMNDIVEARV